MLHIRKPLSFTDDCFIEYRRQFIRGKDSYKKFGTISCHHLTFPWEAVNVNAWPFDVSGGVVVWWWCGGGVEVVWCGGVVVVFAAL